MVVAMGEIRVKAVSFGHKQGPTRSAIREPSPAIRIHTVSVQSTREAVETSEKTVRIRASSHSRHAALTVASESIVRQFMAPRVLRTTVSCTPQRKGYAHNPKQSTEAV
jgi:hypothetical protein